MIFHLQKMLVFYACATAFLPAPAQAQIVPTVQMEQQSVSLMRRGKRLETAITSLAEAVRREPKNPRYAVLLACAQAERAYVLASVVADMRFTARRRILQQNSLAEWERAQQGQDPQNPLFGKPKPEFPKETPGELRTIDDNKPLALTEDAICVRVRELSESSLKLLETAARLPAEAKSESQAENAFLSGWTALVLWQLPRKIVLDSWPTKDGKAEGPERIIAFLDRAVTLQPDNSSYRLGLADACLIGAVDKDSPFLPATRFDKALYERGKTLLVEAAKRRPNDSALWYRIACMEGQGDNAATGLAPRTPENIAALRKTAALSSNALIWYALGAAQASIRDDAGMMTSLESANAAPVLLPVRYKYSAPTLVGWVFPDMTCQYPLLHNLTVIGLMRRGRDAKKENDAETVERTVQIARQMSKKFEAAAKNPALIGEEQALFLVSASLTKVFTDGVP